jgi:hypothetical protein
MVVQRMAVADAAIGRATTGTMEGRT